MKPTFKNKYRRRENKPTIDSTSLRRSSRKANKQPSINYQLLTPPSLPSPTSSSSSNTESVHTTNPGESLRAFDAMVLDHEKENLIPPSVDIHKPSTEARPSPKKDSTMEQPTSEAAEGKEIKKGEAEVEIITLDEINPRPDPLTKASPATATVIPPTTGGSKIEVRSFDLNKPPTNSMKVVDDFESLLGDKPYYTTVINGQRVNIFKPPHLYVKNASLAKPIFEKSSFEVGSGSRNPCPTVMTASNRHGLTFGSSTRNNSLPIDVVPLQSRPPATGSLFDLLGLNTEMSKPTEKPHLTTYQLSLLNTLARSTPGGPPPNLSIPFSPPPTGGVKRPSGIVFKETPIIKKPFNKEPAITNIEFQAWKLYQERIRLEAVEKAEKRVYTQLWGTIMALQKQCMDYNQKVADFDQQISDMGLSIFEKNDRIDNLEMLLGLAIKSLKMDARELMKFRNQEKGKTNVVEDDKLGNKDSSMHEMMFGAFTPEELNVLHGKERLMQLNHLLQKVGGGVGCSELAVVSEGCCNRLVVNGGLSELEDEIVKEERKETENRKEGGEADGSSKKEEERKKEKVLDGMHTTTTKPAFYPTPRE